MMTHSADTMANQASFGQILLLFTVYNEYQVNNYPLLLFIFFSMVCCIGDPVSAQLIRCMINIVSPVTCRRTLPYYGPLAPTSTVSDTDGHCNIFHGSHLH